MNAYDRPSAVSLDLVCDDERVAGPDFYTFILEGLASENETFREWCVRAAERHGIEAA